MKMNEQMIREAVADLQDGDIEAWARLNPLAWGDAPGSEQYTESDFETFRRVMHDLGVPESQWTIWHCALIDLRDQDLQGTMGAHSPNGI